MINNRYKILKKIGEGRSCVYHCTDIKTNSDYAIKIISPSASEEELNKFSEEYGIIKRLNHPGIIKAYEYGIVFETDYDDIASGSRFIVLELFRGKELSGLKNLSEENLKEIMIAIVSALQYLHMSNFVYYDLKPENILVDIEETIPVIKIIDFGFAGSLNKNNDKTKRGTAEYIAPELLKNETYDHRIDYYSLGILLYKLIYNSFPFDNSSELKIFRAQLEDNFTFPENSYSPGINLVLRKLLLKEPQERYWNAVQIFEDLMFNPSAELLSSWIPAKSFSGRRDVLNILNNYLINYSGGDVFVLRGAEGSGKTAVLREFSELKKSVVFIKNAKTSSGLHFINDFVTDVLYNENIFPVLNTELRERMKNFLINPPHNITGEVKGIFSQLVRTCRFILLIDDFNYLDELSLQLFREIIPIFQVHNIKIVLTENSDKPALADYILNLHQLNLSPFTDNQVQEMLDSIFYSYYPKEELKKLILLHADLLPGSIEAFIKDLILFGIIKFTSESIDIVSDERTIKILKCSHEYFYKLRIESLSKPELHTIEYLSAFETIPVVELLPEFVKGKISDTWELLQKLSTKNILHVSELNLINFTSAGMKEYIYSNIKNKKRIHLKNASVLENLSPLNRKEIAYQYEAAADYEKSIYYYMIIFHEASLIDAYTYQKKLLEHMISMPVPEEKKYVLKFELCKVLLNTGDPVSTLELCDELLLYNSDPAILNELLLLKGISLIGIGRSEEGIRQIEYLVDVLEDEERKKNLLTEIASAYLDINNYTMCEKISNDIIKNSITAEESKGKCFNFLGLIAIHRDNDFDTAYKYFKSAEQIYSSAGLKFRTAQMQTNLGNIRNIKGDNDSAEELWNSSLELNTAMGNLQHEAILLLNFGVLNFMKLDYEKSIGYYKKALSIFSLTGDQRGEGLVNHNLGELYYLSCEYKNSLKYLTEARTIFENLQNVNEELETLYWLGILYSSLGSRKNLAGLLEDFEKLLHREPNEKHKYNFRFLKLLLNNESLNFFHEIKDIIRYYNKQSVKNNFFRASITTVAFLYEHQLYKEAAEELNNKALIDAVESNNFYKAEWELYSGMVFSKMNEYDIHPGEYFLRALKLIEGLSISELTWKIMTVLAEFYHSRGNFLRAEEYAYYAYSLIEHIAEGIGDEVLRNCYLGKKETAGAVALCKKILPNNG